MARVTAVEGLILVQKVVSRNQSAVNVAILEGDRIPAIVLDVPEFFSSARANNAFKNDEIAMTEYDAATNESGVPSRFVVQRSRHL